MDSSLREFLFESTYSDREILVDREKSLESNPAEDDAVDRWRFELGRQYGGDATLQQENQRLTLPKCARHKE